jgi:hypothetical protein
MEYFHLSAWILAYVYPQTRPFGAFWRIVKYILVAVINPVITKRWTFREPLMPFADGVARPWMRLMSLFIV